MLVVNIGLGLGAVLVIDGKLYHGAQDIVGEIGHMTIDLHGEKCECGNRGCLQTYTFGPSIVRLAKSKMVFDNQEHVSITGTEIYGSALNGN